ncbi:MULTISPECIES: hypothetical protein [unclassified Bacillus (in: firmicutes)]|uniref:hypothetical protein n=1 Tax=unclassified Bacillus (in: firmicutes) TaxID=185979 RepID=UPI000BEF6E64|nr:MULTISPECIES: hypothetical protein [unclassified Bacillus (in: firmicutes)]PEJ60094.1 hypothetical protein CN692_02050 [Bacillus sp. AFS002410]PEL07646.1 hypothetical protein CN601_19570 [Bacillus sp. AFS017336]
MLEENFKEKEGKDQEQKTNIDDDSLQASLERQIVAASWVKAVAQLYETITLSKLYSIDKDPIFQGKRDIISGMWIGTAGQLSVAFFVSKQLFTSDKINLLDLQRKIVLSDSIQIVGNALALIGAAEVIQEEVGDGEIFLS